MKARLSKRELLILAAASCLSLAIYLLISARTYRTGFPLDDAWIHQTYARNLASGLGWTFIPGEVSAGSTSPFWTVVLAAGFLLRLGPYIWAFLIGGVTLWGLAVLGEAFARSWLGERKWILPWAGLLICFEWHLVWAALSGMETLLFGLVITLVLCAIALNSTRWLWLGLAAGLAIWVRPDAVTLLGPIVFYALLRKDSWSGRLHHALLALAGSMLGILPYLGFNRLLAGAWWPNTFYAKQAEYAILQETPWVARFLAELSLPLIGVGIVLMPGVIWLFWKGVTGRQWGLLAGGIWWLGYLGLYAWRLPVTYQHGRYIMPAMAIFFLWGFVGIGQWLQALPHNRWARRVGFAWRMTSGALLLVFWGIVSSMYAKDVAIIETEMVEPAQWVAQQTPPDSLVAAHDIGALGFFGQRRIIDLAGLISPEVIPLMRDEYRLREHLDQAGTRYLVLTFDWYVGLAENKPVLYQSSGEFAPELGAENTRIYLWKSP